MVRKRTIFPSLLEVLSTCMYIELGVSIAKIRRQPKCRFMNLHPHGGSVVKNPPASAGDMGSIPGSGRPSAEGKEGKKEMAPHFSILAWEIPWTRSLTGYSPWGHKESDTVEWPNSSSSAYPRNYSQRLPAVVLTWT